MASGIVTFYRDLIFCFSGFLSVCSSDIVMNVGLLWIMILTTFYPMTEEFLVEAVIISLLLQ